ncbi:MAG TPA: hypothetical protein VN647_09420 [Nitrospira sp.]|nr:hypothetical protein [Nitrospira sp.]
MKTTLRGSLRLLLVALVALFACSEFETAYFQDKVDHVTQNVVAGRYGMPHKEERLPAGGSVWTYFDRGSGTVGYTGHAESSKCKAYLLTFDQSGVLRDWKQQDCMSQSGPITEPSSDHN